MACRVLDVVTVSGSAEEGRRGVVTQVREYPDGSVRYSVSVDDDALLVTAEQVLPTGERETLTRYLPPGALFPWDEVELRRETTIVHGVVDGWFEDGGITKYTVWLPETGELEICEEHEIRRLGRSQMRRRGRATSTRVSESGEAKSVDEYDIVEDLMDVIADSATDDFK